MEHRNFKFAALALVGLLAAGPLRADGMGADIQDSLEDLRSSMGALSNQVNNLNKGMSDLIKFKGDFRYRYENVIDRSLADNSGSKDLYRERYRIRFRLAADAKVTDFIKVKARLATGSNDPVSTNQTLQDYGGNKTIMLDYAEADIAPDVMLHPLAQFGKMGTPFKQVPGEMVFDGDLTPEGVALTLEQRLFAGLSASVVGAQFINTEVQGMGVYDSKFEGGQLVLSYDLGFGKLDVAGAYYNWVNETGATENAALTAKTLSQDFNTNSAALLFWIDDYSARFKTNIAGIGTDLYYEYTYNAQQKQDNVGSLVGIELASGKLIPMDSDYLKVGINYRHVQKNYTYSGWNFSDFANSETDAEGCMSYAKVKILPHTEIDLTYFGNTRGLDTIAAGGKGKTWERYQLDLVVGF